MLYALMDGRARSSTELAALAEVTPSTASVHLNRLAGDRLVKVLAQGKHRYYSLHAPEVARALEALSVLAGGPAKPFVPSTPVYLRAARTCYDHIAGSLGVALHDGIRARGWIQEGAGGGKQGYELTATGETSLTALGIDPRELRESRRRFAFPCLDWSERRPHIGGAVGAAILHVALKRNWVTQDLDSRALAITRVGEREFSSRFGFQT